MAVQGSIPGRSPFLPASMGAEELNSPDLWRAAFAEFLAMAIFCFIGVGSVAVVGAGGGILSIALAHGLAFALLVAGIGAISGGHINPAITFSMIVTGRISVVRGAVYIVAQLAGAVLGVALLSVLLVDGLIDATAAGGNEINRQVVPSDWGAIGLEAVGTFILVWTVFAVSVTPRDNKGIVAPLFIGLAVLVVHLVLIPLTGAGINPARTFGPMLVNDAWTDWWIFWVGPLLGGFLAGMSYYVLYLMEPAKPAAADTAT